MKEKAKQTTAVSKSHASPTTSTRIHASGFSVTVFPGASDPHHHVNGRQTAQSRSSCWMAEAHSASHYPETLDGRL